MRVLLVEDDPDLARSLRRGLSEASYAVDISGTGEEALERAGVSSYDAIILDIVIPPPDVSKCAGSSAPAVVNALARLTGKRYRALPLINI